MGERIKELRNFLGLTQQQFADSLGIKRNTIAKYETGRGDPIDAVVSLICNTYNVTENWLRNGEPPMLLEVSRDQQIMDFIASAMKGESDNFKRRLLAVLSRLNESEWAILEKRLRELVDETKKED